MLTQKSVCLCVHLEKCVCAYLEKCVCWCVHVCVCHFVSVFVNSLLEKCVYVLVLVFLS